MKAATLLLGVAPVAGERTYQGKRDTPAWGIGERTVRHAQINQRTLTQNEHHRINH